MFLLATAIFTGLAQAQSKVIGEKGSRPVIGEKGAAVVIDDDGFISFIGRESLASIFGEEVLLEVLGGESIVSIIGEKGSEKIIGEKGSEKIIGEKGSEKIIGEKGSEKIIGEKGSGEIIGEKGSGEVIGEKGRVVRGVKTGRTVQFVGTDFTGAATLTKLNVGNRLQVKTQSATASPGSTYLLIEPEIASPCCAVVKVTADGNVLAENRATRDSFYFVVADPKIRRSLRAGQLVGTDRERRWAFIRTSAVRGLKGLQATYSFPIRRDSGKQPSTPAGGRRPL
jgi:hypothetical protein